MRLIDADALKKALCEEYEAREHYIGEKMIEAIDNAPTVEQSQGEWYWNEQGYFYCNKCNRQPRDQYAVSNFCPNCGAKMKLG